MCMRECSGAGQDDMQGVANTEFAALIQNVLHTAAVDELHGEIVETGLLAYPVAAKDIGVIEPGHNASFALEALHEIGIGGQVLEEDLDGDFAVEAFLKAFVDLTHAACAELLQKFVLA